MEFTEMEKRMLYQTEGSERYAVLQEMSMASRYAGDPARRKAAKSLLEKLRPLTDAECMEAVHDIRRNYRLPQEGRTIGELLAQARQRSGAEQLKGHDIMGLERFDPEVRHMVIFDAGLVFDFILCKMLNAFRKTAHVIILGNVEINKYLIIGRFINPLPLFVIFCDTISGPFSVYIINCVICNLKARYRHVCQRLRILL